MTAAHDLPAPLAGYAAADLPAAAGSSPVAGRGKLPAAGTVGGPQRGAQGRTWTVELPAGLEVLNLNKRLHWAKERAVSRELRKAAWALSLQQNIPHLQRARIVVEYQPPRVTRRRDAENIPAPSGKHAIDGLVDARVLPDDECPRYVEKIEHLIGEPYPRGRLILHITEIAYEAKAGAA